MPLSDTHQPGQRGLAPTVNQANFDAWHERDPIISSTLASCQKRRWRKRKSSPRRQHNRFSAYLRMTTCRLMPHLEDNCRLIMHSEMRHAMPCYSYDAQTWSGKVLSRRTRWRSFNACRAQNRISIAERLLSYRTHISRELLNIRPQTGSSRIQFTMQILSNRANHTQADGLQRV